MILEIKRDDLSSSAVQALLAEHLRCMHEVSPAECVHALDLAGLRRPEITFWSAWRAGQLAGCGALKELDSDHGEVKSMRTPSAFLRHGVAAAMLARLSGRVHHVLSAVAVRSAGRCLQALSVSEVEFAPLSQARIDAYVAGGEPMGKAGGYAIQGGAEAFVPRLSGSYSGVVGLPLFETARLLRDFGIEAQPVAAMEAG